MNGAEVLLQTAIDAGLDVCFANPGTTEMPLVAALDSAPGLRAVLGLQENVTTGAADGYARMTGKPALTLLHLGPGFANGISNLHNARRARTPIINLIGEHATWHAAADAPLASDIESLARPVSGWVRRSNTAAGMAGDMAEAIAAATSGSGQGATMILPHDLQMGEAGSNPAKAEFSSRPAAPSDRITAAAAALTGEDTLLFLGNAALSEAGLKAASRIARATGCGLMSQTSNARVERGTGLPHFAKLPYLPEMALEALAGKRMLVLAGALSPVGFFGWPGMPSSMLPEGTEAVTLALPDEDIVAALEALAGHLSAPAYEPPAPQAGADMPDGALTSETLCGTLAALQPENAILVNEAITSGWSYHQQSRGAPRFTELSITGGAIGCGPSLALGAALAAPDRPVINLQADGSGLYTPQALWSQAREGAKVITVICSNRRYNILQVELARAGLNRPGPNAQSLTELNRPAVDWPQVARGFGVEACAVQQADELADALRQALSSPGPSLIEAVMS